MRGEAPSRQVPRGILERISATACEAAVEAPSETYRLLNLEQHRPWRLVMAFANCFRHPFEAASLRKLLGRPDLPVLSAGQINHAERVLATLFETLRRMKPVYEAPVTGWGLVATPLGQCGQAEALGNETFTGYRQLFLDQAGGLISVLLGVHPSCAFSARVLAKDPTTVDEILTQDPSLYGSLVKMVRRDYVDSGIVHWPQGGPSLAPTVL